MIYRDFQDLKLSALGMGAMRLPVMAGDDSAIDEAATAEMVAYEMCIRDRNTITAVYPRYYPEAVVDFFCSLHNRTNISRDIEDGCVRVLWSDGRMVRCV